MHYFPSQVHTGHCRPTSTEPVAGQAVQISISTEPVAGQAVQTSTEPVADQAVRGVSLFTLLHFEGVCSSGYQQGFLRGGLRLPARSRPQAQGWLS